MGGARRTKEQIVARVERCTHALRRALQSAQNPSKAARALAGATKSWERLPPLIACEALDELAQAYFSLDDFERSHRAAQKLASIGEAEAIPSAQGRGFLHAGRAALFAGDSDAAQPILTAAKKLFHHDKDLQGEAQATRNLGDLEIRAGRPRKALSILLEAEQLFRKARDPRGRAATLTTQAQALLILGQNDQAREALLEASRISKRLGNEYGWALAELRRADLDLFEGRMAQVVRTANRLRAFYRHIGDRSGEADALNLLARARFREGLHAQALETVRLSMQLAHRAQIHAAEAEALLLQSDVLVHLDRLEEALSANAAATSVFAKIQDPIGCANALHGQGFIACQLGRDEDATTHLEQAQRLFEQVGDSLGQANCLVYLGRIQARAGNEESARVAYHTAAKIYRKVRDGLGEADALTLLAGIHERAGNLGKALTVIERVVELARTGDRLARAGAYAVRGRLRFVKGMRPQALRDYGTARRLYREEGAPSNLARLEMDLAKRLRQAGDREGAGRAVSEAFALLERVMLTNSAPEIQADLIEQFYEALHTSLSLTWESGRFEDFIVQLESRRAWTLEVPLVSTRSRRAAAPAFPMLDGHDVVQTAKRLTEDSSILLAWYPPTAEGMLPCLVALEGGVWLFEVRARLDELLPSLSEIHRHAEAQDASEWEEPLLVLGEGFLRSSVRVVAAFEDKTDWQMPDNLAGLLQRFPGRLLKIIPHGVLHLVPWSALAQRIDGKIRYLVEDHPHVIVPSLAMQSRIEDDSPARIPRSALLFATGTAQLAHAESEADAVRATLERVGVQVAVCGLDAAQSADRFLTLAAQYDLLHIATHAVFDTANPFRSRIELQKNSEDEDSSLRLAQVLRAPKAPTTVVLSACTTALSDWNRVFNPIALTVGFLARGASRAVGSLWKVDDRSTAHLNRRLYTEVIGKQKDWANALRSAQLRLLLGERDEVAEGTSTARTSRGMLSQKAMSLASERQREPYYWAGFQVVGSR